MQLLEFTPLYIERIWGGQKLTSKYGRALPKGRKIGESWEIVDRKEQQSVVSTGPFSGLTLRELITRFPSDILGPGSDPYAPFPILVKWLDCSQRLSLQVHPDADAAAALGGDPKTEHWYIVDADEGATLVTGLREGVGRQHLERALAKGKVEDCLHFVPSIAGDSLLIKGGCVHAIGAGNLILEIQQNSDTTYRMHDWNRLGLDGLPRQLHLQESLRSIDFSLSEQQPMRSDPGIQALAECSEFRIRKFEQLPDDCPILLPAGEQPRLIHMVAGEFSDQVSGQSLQGGRNYLQPYAVDLALVAKTSATLLVTDYFIPNLANLQI